jgi:hypothetical protein
MRVRYGPESNNSSFGTLLPEKLVLGFQNKGCTPTTDEFFTTQCRYFAAGQQRITVENTTAPSIAPTGCVSPRLLRSGRWTFTIEDSGALPSP